MSVNDESKFNLEKIIRSLEIIEQTLSKMFVKQINILLGGEYIEKRFENFLPINHLNKKEKDWLNFAILK